VYTFFIYKTPTFHVAIPIIIVSATQQTSLKFCVHYWFANQYGLEETLSAVILRILVNPTPMIQIKTRAVKDLGSGSTYGIINNADNLNNGSLFVFCITYRTMLLQLYNSTFMQSISGTWYPNECQDTLHYNIWLHMEYTYSYL
jgi:hypothetical protein